MGKSGEFYTLDETLKRLSIDETKLKRLVSEGEIRAFREGDQMKFRRADVDNLDLTGARSEEEAGASALPVAREEPNEGEMARSHLQFFKGTNRGIIVNVSEWEFFENSENLLRAVDLFEAEYPGLRVTDWHPFNRGFELAIAITYEIAL